MKAPYDLRYDIRYDLRSDRIVPAVCGIVINRLWLGHILGVGIGYRFVRALGCGIFDRHGFGCAMFGFDRALQRAMFGFSRTLRNVFISAVDFSLIARFAFRRLCASGFESIARFILSSLR